MTPETSRWPSEPELAQVLGLRIRQLREERGLSQRALAEQLRLSKSIVAKYEGGIHAPSIVVLVRLADFFGVSLDRLLGREVAEERLRRCLAAIESMDAASRTLVVDAIEGIVSAYRLLFTKGARGAEPQ